MSDRKSGRARKVVDYTKFGGNDDFDDDFADSTPPVSKKPRLSNHKENEKKKANKNVQKEEKENKMKQKNASNRKSLDERRYERELQEALELSMSQSDPSQESDAPNNTDKSEAAPVITEERDAPSPILPTLDNPPVLTKIIKAEDEIQVLENDIEEVPSSRRGASKKKKYIDSDSGSGGEDSDFAPNNDDDDDSLSDDDDDCDDEDDYNPEDSDSDFGSSKKKKPVKKMTAKTDTSKGTTKNSKITTDTTKPSVPKSAIGTKSTVVGKKGITHKPLATSSPNSHKIPAAGVTAHKPPNWKPPGVSGGVKSPAVLNTKTNSVKSPVGNNIKTRPALSGSIGKSPLGGVNIKSPSSGLRLGLSRNMKLKPLHPNLKMQH